MKISKLTNRILFVSPTVQAGWESESFRSDFEQICELGKGSYGTVWKARHKKTGAIYAIKEIKKKTINSSKMLQHVKNEVKIMYFLNHPNIVKLYNHFEDQFSIYFVLEFLEKGELYKIVLNSPRKRLDESQAARYIKQIVLALNCIHTRNIIHRDIKPQNILLSKESDAKLADFGWSNFLSHAKQKRDTYCGTLDYLAPQMVESSHAHDWRVDIWSMGVLIYELCTGYSPFSNQLGKKKKITQIQVKKNILQVKYSIPEFLTPQCHDLISKILKKNPEERLSLEAILNHPWLILNTGIQRKGDELRSKWLDKLKSEFSFIYECKQEEKALEGFSKEEIYNCCRMESIISLPKEREEGDKQVKEFELRVRELELKNKIQQEQLKYLRSLRAQHSQFQQLIQQYKQKSKQQQRKIDILYSKVQEYQRRINEYEKQKNLDN